DSELAADFENDVRFVLSKPVQESELEEVLQSIGQAVTESWQGVAYLAFTKAANCGTTSQRSFKSKDSRSVCRHLIILLSAPDILDNFKLSRYCQIQVFDLI